jgi:hypothetical protein
MDGEILEEKKIFKGQDMGTISIEVSDQSMKGQKKPRKKQKSR